MHGSARFMEGPAYAVTFCDRAENHVGMQMVGGLREGFTVAELDEMHAMLANRGVESAVHRLELLLPAAQRDDAEAAAVLVITNGVGALLGSARSGNALLAEVEAQPYDTKALMGRGANRTVKNKHARHNNCIADVGQAPDYEAGKGTVVAFSSLPLLSRLRTEIAALSPKAVSLVGETNKYFDVRRCGIGWHGDAERRVVVGVRLGNSAAMPLKFQWFQRSQPTGAVLALDLAHGDMYVMSEKATGHDWLVNKRGLTLRHASGADKYAGNKRSRSGSDADSSSAAA